LSSHEGEIRRGDFNAVRRALISGTLHPNARDDEDDYSILHWAAGHTDRDVLVDGRLRRSNIAERRSIVRELLERGATVNTTWLAEGFSEVTPRTPMDLTEDKRTLQMLREASVRQALAINDPGLLGYRSDHLCIGLVSSAALGRTEDCIALCGLEQTSTTIRITRQRLVLLLQLGTLKLFRSWYKILERT